MQVSFASYPSLKDRVVLITGGASGIGASMVEAFSAQGARVGFLDIQQDAGQELVEKLAGARHRPWFKECDLRDISAFRTAIDSVAADLGPISVLVNNAASDERHDLDDVSVEYWDAAMAVNLRHMFFAAQAVRGQMQELGGGSIINFSSIAWMAGATGMVAYTTAKAGIMGLTNSLAHEFGADGIRVNSIAPGAVVTERQLRLWYTEEGAKEMAEQQFLKQRLEPDELARSALFLAADDSRMITKQCLIVDAGML